MKYTIEFLTEDGSSIGYVPEGGTYEVEGSKRNVYLDSDKSKAKRYMSEYAAKNAAFRYARNCGNVTRNFKLHELEE